MAGRPSISFFINECGRLPYSSANIRNSLEKHNNNPDYYTFRHMNINTKIHFSTHKNK